MEKMNNFTKNLNVTELPNNIQDILQSIITKQNYQTYKVHSKNLSTDGNNFLGDLYEVNIEGQNSDGNFNKHLFLKHIIYNDDFKVYSIPEVYMKEVFLYTELSKIYNTLQDQANIPSYNRLKIARCYDETNSECIVLENMSKHGYKTMQKMEIMSVQFAQFSVIELAKFHGLSFVLQKRRNDYFETKIKTIKQSFIYDDYWNNFVKNMYNVSVARFSGEVKDKLDRFFQLSLDKYPKYMNGLNSDFKCLCHGDYKMNNILFKDTDGVVTEVVPIDYQQIYYGSPVIDLIYFLYASSDRTFRSNYLNTLKDLYFETLMKFLNYFDIDVESVYPRREFERCFSGSIDYALMYTLYMLPMFGFVVDNPPSGKDDIMEISLNVHDRFYVIMQEIVDEFIDYGIL